MVEQGQSGYLVNFEVYSLNVCSNGINFVIIMIVCFLEQSMENAGVPVYFWVAHAGSSSFRHGGYQHMVFCDDKLFEAYIKMFSFCLQDFFMSWGKEELWEGLSHKKDLGSKALVFSNARPGGRLKKKKRKKNWKWKHSFGEW